MKPRPIKQGQPERLLEGIKELHARLEPEECLTIRLFRDNSGRVFVENAGGRTLASCVFGTETKYTGIEGIIEALEKI